MIKFGCSWDEGHPDFVIYIRITVLTGSGYNGLDLVTFEKAFRLIMALKEKGYSFTELDESVECELGLRPKGAQSCMNELKTIMVDVFGGERHTSEIQNRYSYKDSEWDIDESEWAAFEELRRSI